MTKRCEESVSARVHAMAMVGRTPKEIRAALGGESYWAVSQAISRANGRGLFIRKRVPDGAGTTEHLG